MSSLPRTHSGYQTNNFFLPQLHYLIDKGEVINLRPEYQRRLRWTTLAVSVRESSLCGAY